MASAPRFSQAAVQAAVDAVTAKLNVGGAGSLRIYSGAEPANADASVPAGLLATLPLSSTAAPASTSGGAGGTITATFNAITSGTGTAGTAASFCLLAGNGTTIVACGTADVTTNSPDLVLNSTAISTGATVSCSSFTITMLTQ